MRKKAPVWAAVVAVAGLALALGLSSRLQFLAGGALVNLGFRLQDHLDPYDPGGAPSLAPEQVLLRLLDQNAHASKVRAYFPRSIHHPLVAMVVCMDARIDTNELVGDTRKYYYVIRTAGSALNTQEQEMLELAVENGVKVLLLTRHTNCAAEGAERDPAQRARYPELVRALDERSAREAALIARPTLASRIARGALLVRHAEIDTATARMTLTDPPAR
jgi:carbonic anhydrase